MSVEINLEPTRGLVIHTFQNFSSTALGGFGWDEIGSRGSTWNGGEVFRSAKTFRKRDPKRLLAIIFYVLFAKN